MPDSSESGVLELLAGHASCRAYRDDPVPETDLRRAIEAGQRAASSSNLHMWSAVVVRDRERRHRLAVLCGDQAHIRSAPVFIAWCADRNRLDRAAESRGYRQNTEFLESFLVAAVDTAIAMQNATVAFEALGYGCCYIGGLRNDTAAVVDLLELPAHVVPVAGMTVGVPARPLRRRPRPALDTVLHWERYTPAAPDQLLEYDRVMRDTGIYHGRHAEGVRPDGQSSPDVPDAEYGWMEHSARRVSVPRRTDLRSVVERQGYGLG